MLNSLRCSMRWTKPGMSFEFKPPPADPGVDFGHRSHRSRSVTELDPQRVDSVQFAHLNSATNCAVKDNCLTSPITIRLGRVIQSTSSSQQRTRGRIFWRPNLDARTGSLIRLVGLGNPTLEVGNPSLACDRSFGNQWPSAIR